MKNLLYLLFLIPAFLHSDDSIKDSLEQRLATTTGIEQIQTWRALSEALENDGYEASRGAAMKAVMLAKAIENTKETGLSLSNLAIIEDMFARYQAALRHFEEAHPLLKKAADPSEQATNRYNWGMAHYHLGDNATGLDFCNESLELYMSVQDSAGVAENLNGIGLILQAQGKFAESSKSYFKALNWAQESKKSNIIGNIGILLFHMGEVEKALEYFRQCYALEKAKNAKVDMGYTLTYLAGGHYQSLNFDSAEHYYRAAYSLNLENDHLEQIQSSLMGLFRSLVNQNKKEEVFETIRELEALNYKENTYRQVLENIKFESFQMLGQIDSANHYLKIARDSAIARKDWSAAVATSRALAGNYGRSQDWQKCAQAMRIYTTMKDSLFQSERTEVVQQLSVEYETEKKEAEIRRLRIEEDNARFRARSWTIGAILTALLAALLLGFQYINNRKNREIKMAHLRTQIASDLHEEMGSLLTGITMQAQMMQYVDNAESKVYQDKIIANSQTAIATMRDVIWSIDSHYDQMGGLVDRMKMHAAELLNPLQIQWEFNVENWNKDQVMSPVVRQNLYLIFKEAINNIAKHAPNDRVLITLKQQKDEWKIDIENRNEAKKPAAIAMTQGNGLRNMEMRAKRIGASFRLLREQGFQLQVSGKAFS
ncbi:MAG: tetratricopeptide repeat protein [Bacteroidia bacterium]